MSLEALAKTPTGIEGLDEITGGGLPRGRTSLVCGSAGSGKTVLGMEFLVRGARDFGEPGVFMAFEETERELAQNVACFGFDLEALAAQGKLALDHVFLERGEIEETGEYDLEALFVRLGDAIDTVKAKRVVLDSIEVLFGGLQNEGIVRSELRRLFRWLKDKGVTSIVTGERGDGSLTRYGLEEYVADCVILLDHRVSEQISTRRLRIVKYRGSFHGADEYPFLMGQDGISVLPITSLGLNHEATEERISSGVPDLDAMLGGKGLFRAGSTLVSGTPGTGKSSLAAHFALAACKRGERALYLGFEESAAQILRNMKSIGLDLRPWVDKGLLHLETVRPSSLGLEAHLVAMHRLVVEVDPRVIVVDPISTFLSPTNGAAVKSMLTRLVDYLKTRQITALFTHLASPEQDLGPSEQGVSSIMDSWLQLRDVERDGRRSYGILVLKARGMAHSHEIREFVLSDHGIRLGGICTQESTGAAGR
jgi:circadian clock protein KaiC